MAMADKQLTELLDNLDFMNEMLVHSAGGVRAVKDEVARLKAELADIKRDDADMSDQCVAFQAELKEARELIKMYIRALEWMQELSGSDRMELACGEEIEKCEKWLAKHKEG